MNPVVVILIDALLQGRQFAFGMHLTDKVVKLLVFQWNIMQRLDVCCASIEVVGIGYTADCLIELSAAIAAAHDDGAAPFIAYRLEDIDAESAQVAHDKGVRVIL